MSFYGRRVTNGDGDLGEVGVSQQRATVYNPMPENGWGHKIGFWGGKPSGQPTPSVRLGVWAVSASMTPAHRLAYTGVFSVSAIQSYGGDGLSYSGIVTNANTSPAPNAIKMYAGHRYAIGPVATSGLATYAMRQASKITADNKYLYTNNGVSFPTDPFAHDESSYEGHIAAWIEYQANRTPTAACSSPSGLVTSTTPTFSGTFTDADAAYGDRMTRIRLQVVRVSDNAVMWDSGSLIATSAEQAASAFTRAYAGTTLTSGADYTWRCQVADEFTTWSAWTAYTTFTVNGGGIVAPSSPSGRQNSLQPSPFVATWDHASSFSTNAIEVRLLQGGTVIRTSPTLAKTVADNGAISVTWAEAFDAYALTWGVSGYMWQVRGRDTSSLWSNWSTATSIPTNSPPDVPYNLSPTNSQPSTSRPILRCTATDADGDTLTVKARIKDAAGTVLFTQSMTHVGNGVFEHQTTSTDLATFATYKWDAYGYDGVLYSGAATIEASATASSESTFVYAEGPVVTITSATTLTTSAPTISWTVADQQKYQLLLVKDGATAYDSGTVTSTTSSHTIPSGTIRNSDVFELTVTVTNSAPLSGTSSVSVVTVDYPTPETITNLTASPEHQRYDAVPSSIRLTWDVSTDPNFLEYLITRLGGEAGEVLVDRISSPTQTVFVDYLPESNVEYAYQVVQATMLGLDILVSDPAEAQTTTTLENVVLVNVHNPIDGRASLRLDSDRSFTHVDDLVLEHAWGAAAPVGVYGTAQYQTFNGTFTLATDEHGTAADHVNALRSLWRSRATVCYRDERGRKFFAKISKFSESDKRVQFYTVDIDLVEVGHTVGVE